jgi:hypothetical protein
MSNNAELFIRHLDRITARSEDVIRKVEPSRPNVPHVFVFVYKNWPEPGLITGFTFGLSAVPHPDWKFGRPELMISVESLDESWPLAVGAMAEQLRGRCPFCYGHTINFRAKVSKESDLDAFLVFAPLFLKKEQMSVKLVDYTCNIAGMYPLFSSELDLYHEIGLERFWHLPDWDPLNVHRPPLARPDTARGDG